MADDISLAPDHTVAKEVEVGIRKIFPEADIIIHQDPIGSL